jgi:hypothetical protein
MRPHYAHQLAENVAALVVGLASGYSHILAPATAAGKNTCRAWPLCWMWRKSPMSSRVESADTFVRPIYAGNVLATVQSKDAVKVMTVRGTAFPGRCQRPVGQPALRPSPPPAIPACPASSASNSPVRPARIDRCPHHRFRRARHGQRRELQVAGRRSPTNWARRWAPPAPPWTPGSSPMTTRLARPVRWSRRNSMSPSASPAPFSIGRDERQQGDRRHQ